MVFATCSTIEHVLNTNSCKLSGVYNTCSYFKELFVIYLPIPTTHGRFCLFKEFSKFFKFFFYTLLIQRTISLYIPYPLTSKLRQVAIIYPQYPVQFRSCLSSTSWVFWMQNVHDITANAYLLCRCTHPPTGRAQGGSKPFLIAYTISNNSRHILSTFRHIHARARSFLRRKAVFLFAGAAWP